MAQRNKRPIILLAWLGRTDLECAKSPKPNSPGPTASVVDARTFDAVVLLSNYPEAEEAHYRDWLTKRGAPRVDIVHEALADPTDYSGIHNAVLRCMEFVVREFGDDVELAIHISPGTPAMQAVWVLLAKTRFPAELIQSHEKTGVKTIAIPFDISAEYLPEAQRRGDERLQRLSEGLPPEAPEFDEILRRSPTMERAIALARRVAPRNVPVLLEGESGTGKELFARAIHNASLRSSGPFEAVNCGALPRELVESLLFGHEKGAFTGATHQHEGHFEAATGGTLFLDEVGELPLDAQVKLLRALQEHQVRRMGSSKPIPIDVRVIAATNRDLLADLSAGRFREDLYHRLAVGVIRLPPLRERQGDLTLLIDHLLEAINREAASLPAYVQKELSPGARNLLLAHRWPGNVRELQNTLLRLSIWSPGPQICPADVRDELLQPRGSASDLLGRPLGEGLKLRDLMAELARHYIERALSEAQGNKTKAARLVGLASYQTLTDWMKRFGIKLPR